MQSLKKNPKRHIAHSNSSFFQNSL